MMQRYNIMAGLVAALCALCILPTARAKPTTTIHTDQLELRMPQVQPQTDDTYLCYPVQVEDDTLYITGFEPHADMNVSHHMLLYGCNEPGDTQNTWNCGEMSAVNSGDKAGPVCKEGAEILYAWAMDAPDLKLPKDVAFKVGAETNVKWIVLQVHYKDVHLFTGPDAVKDNSGVTLETTTTPQPKTAGVYLLGTGGEIPAHSTVYMETACSVDTPAIMHPFAFRAHTHSHGKVVSGYKIHDGEWQEIGRVSPQLPEMFYSVTVDDVTIENGDILAARCTMTNDEDRMVEVGATQNDEMCNFYIMYWLDGNELPDNTYCFSDGPPKYSWADSESIDVRAIPANASVIPGSDLVIQETQVLDDNTEETLKEIEEALEKRLLMLLSGYDYYEDDNNALYNDDNYDDNGLYPRNGDTDYNDYYPEELESAYNNLQYVEPRYYGDDERYDDQYQVQAVPNDRREQFLHYYESME